MERHDPDPMPEDLLAHGAWLRALALRLVGDADVADDLVQETWIATAQKRPERRESLRPWMAKVLRDAFRMRARGEGRRVAREHAANLALDDDVPTPENLVARAETQRRLVDLVLRLDEPYRSTVLMHFSEGMSLADIARSQGIPAGTVRWRLKTAVDQLRAWIDETGDRRQWVATLLALPKGALVAQKTSKVTIAIVLLLLIGAAVVALIVRGSGGAGAAGGGTRGPGGEARGAASPAGGVQGGANAGAVTEDDPAAAVTWLGQPGVAPRRIAGRVLGLDGTPVGGAAVELNSIATRGGLGVTPHVVTNAAGEFDFGVRVARKYSVAAAAAGKAGSAVSVDLRDPTLAPAPDRLELRLGACDHAVFGTVRDASGGPIEGARVTWLDVGSSGGADQERVPTDHALSSAAGAYELCVAGGRDQVVAEVTADGYGSVVYQTGVWGRRKLDFALVPEAVVVGRVIREDTGAPVAHAVVGVFGAQWGVERTAIRGAISADDGTFRIAGVAPGPHLLEAIAGGFATARGAPIVVEAGQTTDPIELRLETRSIVRGTVLDGGKPVAGAVVSAFRSDSQRGSSEAVTQVDGTFVIDGVARGPVRFVVRPYEVVSPKPFLVTATEHDGVVIEVDALAAIVGKVVHAGKPVAGAVVELDGVNAGDLGPVRSGLDGRFEARGLRPGKWVVFASSDREGAFGRVPTQVELDAGEIEEVTVDLPYAAAISGTVVDQDGAPVPAVTVVFQHTSAEDVGIATTAADGRYRATMMIGAGAYRPTVRLGPRTQSALQPAAGDFPAIELADGASEVTGVILAVRLDHLAISGRVVDEDGGPVADARVAAELMTPGVEPHFWRWYQQTSTMTDADGGFTIGDLSTGSYAVQARTAVGGEIIVPGLAAGRTDVTLVLPSAGSIEGTFAGFEGVPRVFALRQDARSSDGPRRGTVTGTHFSVPSLSPGRYVVSATTDTEVASARVEVAAGTAARVALTGGGSGRVAGRVRDFKSGVPVEGMRCVAMARLGEARTSGPLGDAARTDRTGAFELAPVPAGELAVGCWAQGSAYADGLRLVTLAPGNRLELDVPVVKSVQDPTLPSGGIGADLDPQALVPRLYRVKPRGPAAVAGLVDGDVITAVDGQAVTELGGGSVWLLLLERAPGTAVPVAVRRGARTVAVNLVIGPTDGP